jgi:hypothetical protein
VSLCLRSCIDTTRIPIQLSRPKLVSLEYCLYRNCITDCSLDEWLWCWSNLNRNWDLCRWMCYTRNKGLFFWIVLVLLYDEHDVGKSDWCGSPYVWHWRNLLLRRARFYGARCQHQFSVHKETSASQGRASLSNDYFGDFVERNRRPKSLKSKFGLDSKTDITWKHSKHDCESIGSRGAGRKF